MSNQILKLGLGFESKRFVVTVGAIDQRPWIYLALSYCECELEPELTHEGFIVIARVTKKEKIEERIMLASLVMKK